MYTWYRVLLGTWYRVRVQREPFRETVRELLAWEDPSKPVRQRASQAGFGAQPPSPGPSLASRAPPHTQLCLLLVPVASGASSQRAEKASVCVAIC